MTRCLTVTALLFSFTTLAWAADEKKSDMKKPANSNEFAMMAAEGGLMEVQLGQLAVKNAQSEDVKKFGQRMVDDHSKANDELKSIAKGKNINLPTDLKKEHKDHLDMMAKLNGSEFDRHYMQMMLKDHQEDVPMFEQESKTGTDADIKAFAGKTLPTLRDHLKMAREVATKVGVTDDAQTAGSKQGPADQNPSQNQK